MSIDATQPGTPGWWMRRLMARLDERAPHYDLLWSYYAGTNGIPTMANRTTRDAYRRLMHMARFNIARLIVEALRERTQPTGFRTGAVPDALGDAEAWRIWQANGLDADSSIVHRAKFAMGDSYVSVGPIDEEIGAPLITVEDPRQTITEQDPQRKRRTVAGLKVWRDDVAGVDRAFLYLPGYLVKAIRPAGRTGEVGRVTSFDGWEWDGEPERLPVEQVPIVRFGNQVDAFGCSEGEYEPHLGILDRISYTVLTRLEIATLQAFKQRAIKGVPDRDPVTGAEINYDDIFASEPGAFWILPETATVWESQQVDLSGIRQSIRDDIQDAAAATRTPLFYLAPDAANGSAEGASLAREGLVFKAVDRIAETSESWEQVMSLAFLFAGDPDRAARSGMEVIWAPPERYSLSERYDAAAKALAAEVPWRTVMTDVLQFSPQQVDRMAAERATDALLATTVTADAGGVGMEPSDVKARADAMGVLIRSGVDPAAAARQVGLDVTFTGATPVSLRLPESEAAGLEER